jgi:putative ABC transport system ATP-binding protein
MAKKQKSQNQKPNKKEVIATSKVIKTYKLGDNIIEALKGVSISIEEGEFVSILGKSGSGKSTLMHIIGLLDTPTKGSVYLKGKDVSNLSEKELAKIRNKEIGFVFQTFNLLPRLSALDNVALPLVYAGMRRSRREEIAEHVLEQVGLSDRMYHKPNELSGGQRQRVAIARALVNNPSIIHADEPTGNLDTKTSLEIMEIFGKLHSLGNTIILVTHELDISLYAHRVVKLRDGFVESDALNKNYITAASETANAS